ncbi:N-acetylmuramoyl-L-alanine amidase [Actinomycetospora chibensis]|uniref:N-acetylmuramoyl-L-alanine amidase n=1 Tax=Actinomycetospora chibensis TaxID=663606 RepID=A0ABV9RL92_9PSEU|nr:N-acetylmuramoyl-L-alanine amidase [Actinomycetospora chibensis]MDD7922787.1 N-acetylmuramoyl-L-alanine amidase [Actinomycetospora chibensis]
MARHRFLSARPRRDAGLRRGLEAAVVGALGAASLFLGVFLPAEAPPPGAGPRTGTAAAAEPAPVRLDPQAFPGGGCVVLPARTGGSSPTVVLDAGHGGPDPGSGGSTPAGTTVLEKDLTLAVALAAADDLRDRGTTVVLTRSTDALGAGLGAGDVQRGALTTDASQEDLEARVRCANLARADALVSVHFNSFDDSTVGGTETLYEPTRPLAPRSRALAQSLQTSMRARLSELGRPQADRGVVDDSSGGESGGGHLVLLGPRVPGYIDEPSAMPGALVEPLFLTNPGDLDAIASTTGTAALGDAISTGISDYLVGARRR